MYPIFWQEYKNKLISQVSLPLAGAVLDLVEGRGRTPKSSSSAPLLGIRPILISFQTYSCFIFYLHLFCSLNKTYFDHLKIIFSLWPFCSKWESKSAWYVFMNFLKIMKDKVYVWRVGRSMRASKRGRKRRSSQSVEGREGLVGGVGHGQRVPAMEWTSKGWFSTQLSWWWWRHVTMIWQLTMWFPQLAFYLHQVKDQQIKEQLNTILKVKESSSFEDFFESMRSATEKDIALVIIHQVTVVSTSF